MSDLASAQSACDDTSHPGIPLLASRTTIQACGLQHVAGLSESVFGCDNFDGHNWGLQRLLANAN